MKDMPELMERFVRLEGLLRRYQGYSFRRYGPQGNPLKGQGRVLSLLKLQPTITQKELGYLLDMRNQSLGELLSKLEKSGYITRSPSEEDRRTTVISLTAEGERAAADQGRQDADLDQMFDCLNDGERTALTEYLDRIIDSLEKACEEITGQGESFAFYRGGPHRHYWSGGPEEPCQRPGKPPKPPKPHHGPWSFHGRVDAHPGRREDAPGGHEARTGPREYRRPEDGEDGANPEEKE